MKTIQNLFETGHFIETLKKIDELQHSEKFDLLPLDKQYQVYLLKYHSIWQMKDLEIANNYLQSIIQSQESILTADNIVHNLLFTILKLRHVIVLNFWEKDKTIDHLSTIDILDTKAQILVTQLTLADRKQIRYWLIVYKLTKANITFQIKNDIDSTIGLLNSCLAQFTEIKEDSMVAGVYQLKAYAYAVKQDVKLVLENLEQSLSLAKSKGFISQIRGSLSDIGAFYRRQGNLEKALENTLEAKTVQQHLIRLNPGYNIDGLIDGNLGEILLFQGKLLEAEKYLQEALENNKKNKHYSHIAMNMTWIGEIHRLKGEYEPAISALLRAFSYWDQVPERNLGVDRMDLTLLTLLRIDLSEEHLEMASSYMKLLKNANPITMLSNFKLGIKLAEALILKQSKRLTQQAKAQNLLSELIKEPNLGYDYKLLAICNLAGLFIEEYNIYQENSILQEAKQLIEKMHTIGEANQTLDVVIRSLILKAKFSIVDGDNAKSSEYLEQAQIIAQENGYVTLSQQIVKEQNQIRTRSSSLDKPLTPKDVNLAEYLNEVQKYVNLKGE